mgnify:CR=1 FL=1
MINKKISDFSIGVYYNCNDDPNCSLKEEDKSDGYKLTILFNVSNIDLQNIPSPIKKEEPITRILNIFFSFNYKLLRVYEWEIVKYIEKSTLFDRFLHKNKDEDISGHFSKYYNIITENKELYNN